MMSHGGCVNLVVAGQRLMKARELVKAQEKVVHQTRKLNIKSDIDRATSLLELLLRHVAAQEQRIEQLYSLCNRDPASHPKPLAIGTSPFL
jgi:hypothetical protein